PRIVELPGDEPPGQRGAGLGPVGAAELLAADQDVARARGVDPRDDPPRRGQVRQADALVATEFHHTGADQAVAEQCDGVEVVDGDRCAGPLLNLADDVAVIALEVGARREHDQGVDLDGAAGPGWGWFPSRVADAVKVTEVIGEAPGVAEGVRQAMGAEGAAAALWLEDGGGDPARAEQVVEAGDGGLGLG